MRAGVRARMRVRLPWRLAGDAMEAGLRLSWRLIGGCRGGWLDAAVEASWELPWMLAGNCRGSWVGATVEAGWVETVVEVGWVLAWRRAGLGASGRGRSGGCLASGCRPQLFILFGKNNKKNIVSQMMPTTTQYT